MKNLITTIIYCLLSSICIAQTQSLRKNKEGKYIFRYTHHPSFTRGLTYGDKKLWIRSDIVPLGSKVTLKNVDYDTTITAEVVDSLRGFDLKRQQYIDVSAEVAKVLKINSAYDKLTLAYQTSLDSLLKQAAKAPPSDKITQYKLLAWQFRRFVRWTTSPPPVDSLKKMAPRFSPKQQVAYKLFKVRFLKKLRPKEVQQLCTELLPIAQKQQNIALEIECWLHLGDAQYAINRFRNPKKLSPKAYLAYLKIAKAQQWVTKIAVAHKKLGDL